MRHRWSYLATNVHYFWARTLPHLREPDRLPLLRAICLRRRSSRPRPCFRAPCSARPADRDTVAACARGRSRLGGALVLRGDDLRGSDTLLDPPFDGEVVVTWLRVVAQRGARTTACRSRGRPVDECCTAHHEAGTNSSAPARPIFGARSASVGDDRAHGTDDFAIEGGSRRVSLPRRSSPRSTRAPPSGERPRAHAATVSYPRSRATRGTEHGRGRELRLRRQIARRRGSRSGSRRCGSVLAQK